MKSKCKMCKDKINGTGYYTFVYLGDKVVVCGHCSALVMQYIKSGGVK